MLSPFITRVPIFNPSRDHSNDVTWLFTGQNGQNRVDEVNGVDKINPTPLKVAEIKDIEIFKGHIILRGLSKGVIFCQK